MAIILTRHGTWFLQKSTQQEAAQSSLTEQAKLVLKKKLRVDEKELQVRDFKADQDIKRQNADRERKAKAEAEAALVGQERDDFHSLYLAGDLIDVAMPNKKASGGVDWFPAQWAGKNGEGVPLVKWLYSDNGKDIYGPDEEACKGGGKWPEVAGKNAVKWDWVGMKKRFRKADIAPMKKKQRCKN